MKEITLACEAFQKLLEEQLERIRNMNGEKTDFATKKQVINNSLVVIAVVIICGVVIFGLDNLFGFILTWVLRKG